MHTLDPILEERLGDDAGVQAPLSKLRESLSILRLRVANEGPCLSPGTCRFFSRTAIVIEMPIMARAGMNTKKA